jgi:hypothetical protein
MPSRLLITKLSPLSGSCTTAMNPGSSPALDAPTSGSAWASALRMTSVATMCVQSVNVGAG